MLSWGSPSWETAMDTWRCLFSMHLMMGIRYGNSQNRPTPAGATLDTYPIICLHSLTRQALQVKTITRGCGSLTRPKQLCVSPIVTADVTKGRTEIFKFDAQRIICSRAAPYATRPCSVLKTSAVLIYWHGSWSTLAHVMACCLMVPSPYLNQCWLITSDVQWQSSEGNFIRDTPTISQWSFLENHLPKISLKSPRHQWVNPCHWRCHSSASDSTSKSTTASFRVGRAGLI